MTDDRWRSPLGTRYASPAMQLLWGEPHQKSDDVSASGAYLHQTMVAENATGLRNLFYLSSMASYEGPLPAASSIFRWRSVSTRTLRTSKCPSNNGSGNA